MQEVHTPRQGRPSTSAGDPGRRFSQLQRQQSTASQRSIRPQPSLRRSLSNRATVPVPSGQAPAKVGPAGRHDLTILGDYDMLLGHILWTQASPRGGVSWNGQAPTLMAPGLASDQVFAALIWSFFECSTDCSWCCGKGIAESPVLQGCTKNPEPQPTPTKLCCEPSCK